MPEAFLGDWQIDFNLSGGTAGEPCVDTTGKKDGGVVCTNLAIWPKS